MKIVDLAEITVTSGDGGNGAVAFRREKYVSHGGPSGGDGGRGGSVILQATTELQTLLDFRNLRHFKAEHGQPGRSKKMHGRKGQNRVVKVPLGTIVRDGETQKIVGDLTLEGQTFMVAKGGKGGRGNTHFATSTYQAPRYAEPGEPGVTRKLLLELKMIADVGLVGLPNAGKSSLLSVVSAARPKIANYPFTTLKPNLGAIKFPDGDGFIMADIPGLIEGASDGIGLGHEFLRHIERTRLLLHMLDAAEPQALENYRIIQRELSNHPANLEDKPQFIVLNKQDITPENELEALKSTLESLTDAPIFIISALAHQGTQPLLYAIQDFLKTLPPPPPLEIEELEPLDPIDSATDFEISEENGIYIVDSPHLDRLLSLSDLDDSRALHRFQKALKQTGILDALHEAGAETGDTVRIGPLEFEHL